MIKQTATVRIVHGLKIRTSKLILIYRHIEVRQGGK